MQPTSTLTLARKLRKNLTASEAALWRALRGKRLDGLRFRRQHPIGPYIVDFYCASCRLAVEVDGGVHDDEDAKVHDARRDEWLGGQGVQVLRLSDRLVSSNIDDVLSRIAKACGR